MVKVAKVNAKNPATVVRADKEIAFIVATNAISMLSLSGRVFFLLRTGDTEIEHSRRRQPVEAFYYDGDQIERALMKESRNT